jgi:hypothetical protein
MTETDVMIALALRGRPLEFAGSWEFSEAHPEEYIELVRGTYVTLLLQPRWGFLFEQETQDDDDDDSNN